MPPLRAKTPMRSKVKWRRNSSNRLVPDNPTSAKENAGKKAGKSKEDESTTGDSAVAAAAAATVITSPSISPPPASDEPATVEETEGGPSETADGTGEDTTATKEATPAAAVETNVAEENVVEESSVVEREGEKERENPEEDEGSETETEEEELEEEGKSKEGEGKQGKQEKSEVEEEGSETEEEEEEEGEEEEEEEGELEEEEEGKSKEGEGEQEQSVEGSSSDEDEENDQENEQESDDEPAALLPLRMHFPLTEYTKKTKIGTRCYLHECLTTLDKLVYPLSRDERSWFETHPQFKHIFHMPRDNNHKVMGMWMLLLRTACIEKRKEAWFIVNGVPVRYGIREHALLSGLNCRNYPLHYLSLGSKNFVNKHFKEGTVVRYQDVKEKLETMKPGKDRLKMAVLFFLSSIIIAQTKCGERATPVVEFFQRVVDDLELCKTFPWGRLSFDHMMKEISRAMDHYQGFVKENALWPIPGFVVPLEASNSR